MLDSCQQCKEREPTYEVIIDSKMHNLCDYCYHLLKWKNPEKECIVESHLSTKESMQLYNQAIKDFLLPQMKELITKDAVSQLLKIEKEKGMESVFNELKKNHQTLIKQFCMKNNLSYPELITGLRMFQNN